MGSVDGFDEGDKNGSTVENNEGLTEGIAVGFGVGPADGATEGPDDVVDSISEGLGLVAYEGESVATLGTTEGTRVITDA